MNKNIVFETLHTWNTNYSADSIEWCPIESFQNVFVCGTYQLRPDEAENCKAQVRLGKIYLFIFDTNVEILKPIQTIETVAILDQKWSNHVINCQPYLAVVNAKGFLQIYALKLLNEKLQLELVTESSLDETSTAIVTSVDWSNNKHTENDPSLVVTDTTGNVTVFQLKTGTKSLDKINSWKAHDYEAWICAFNCWNPSIIISGGDDCMLKMFDTRCEMKAQRSIIRNAGVTSLHFNANDEHILASGSYDETLCIWDMRKLKNTLGDIGLGGGIWRLKWEPKKHKILLAACMHNGFSIVDCEDNSKPQVIGDYDEHESLAYGSDWCHDLGLAKSHKVTDVCNLIGTCSFYDCKMNIVKIIY